MELNENVRRFIKFSIICLAITLVIYYTASFILEGKNVIGKLPGEFLGFSIVMGYLFSNNKERILKIILAVLAFISTILYFLYQNDYIEPTASYGAGRPVGFIIALALYAFSIISLIYFRQTSIEYLKDKNRIWILELLFIFSIPILALWLSLPEFQYTSYVFIPPLLIIYPLFWILYLIKIFKIRKELL